MGIIQLVQGQSLKLVATEEIIYSAVRQEGEELGRRAGIGWKCSHRGTWEMTKYGNVQGSLCDMTKGEWRRSVMSVNVL